MPNCLPRASYIIYETYWKIKMWAPWLKKWLWISRQPIVSMKSTARKLWIWDQSQAHEAGPAPTSMPNVMRVLQKISKQNASNFFVIISLATFSILYFMAKLKIIWTNLLEEHGRTKKSYKEAKKENSTRDWQVPRSQSSEPQISWIIELKKERSEVSPLCVKTTETTKWADDLLWNSSTPGLNFFKF